MLFGMGFILTAAEAATFASYDIVRPFVRGRDLAQIARNCFVIDTFGLSEHDLMANYPHIYQWLRDRVKPERDEKPDGKLKSSWWLFGAEGANMRRSWARLNQVICTPRTARHRYFTMVSTSKLVESEIVAIGHSDHSLLAVLSSHQHVTWSLAAGARLGVGNDPRYNNSLCFDPFPFPTPTEAQTLRLRALGEELDAHRKARQAAHPKLTLTGMYNTLEKLRAGERIEGKDREIYDQGLVGILRDIHDKIDAEVAAAYGWPVDLSDEEILQRLVDLNHTRAAEEARGLVRWLRPDYQNPGGHAVAAKGETVAMDLGPVEADQKAPWPKSLPEQIAAVRAALLDLGEASPEQVARRFQRARAASVLPLLESLTLLGQARLVEGGRFAA